MAGPAHPGHPARDDALDALRGVAVAGMAVVNLQVPDQGYALLRHATWNGLTLADIVFPVFLLAVGLSTPLAIDRRGAALAGLLRRTALLFAIGVALGWLLRPTLDPTAIRVRSEEHTSELQSLMRISYAVFCLKKKKQKHHVQRNT